MNIKNDRRRSLGKRGSLAVEDIVTFNNSIFHEIVQDNDIGIDCQIELIGDDDSPINKIIAAQIKTGDSYFNVDKTISRIPIGKHFRYWLNHPLPVFGITCHVINASGDVECYWTNIKEFLKENYEEISNERIKTVEFQNTQSNNFSKENFKKYFIPHVLKKPPILGLDEVMRLMNSSTYEKLDLGVDVAFYYHYENLEVWKKYISIIKHNETDKIPYNLIYCLSHIPWHGDLWGRSVPQEIRKIILQEINNFGREHVIKLLFFVDENGLERGSLGQCVFSIIQEIRDYKQIIKEVLTNQSIEDNIRNSAAIVYYQTYDSVETLQLLQPLEKTEFMQELIDHIYSDLEN